MVILQHLKIADNICFLLPEETSSSRRRRESPSSRRSAEWGLRQDVTRVRNGEDEELTCMRPAHLLCQIQLMNFMFRFSSLFPDFFVLLLCYHSTRVLAGEKIYDEGVETRITKVRYWNGKCFHPHFLLSVCSRDFLPLLVIVLCGTWSPVIAGRRINDWIHGWLWYMAAGIYESPFGCAFWYQCVRNWPKQSCKCKHGNTVMEWGKISTSYFERMKLGKWFTDRSADADVARDVSHTRDLSVSTCLFSLMFAYLSLNKIMYLQVKLRAKQGIIGNQWKRAVREEGKIGRFVSRYRVASIVHVFMPPERVQLVTHHHRMHHLS